jgi:hypothetical protein
LSILSSKIYEIVGVAATLLLNISLPANLKKHRGDCEPVRLRRLKMVNEFEYYYLQGVARMDILDEGQDFFLIRKGEAAILQYFPNRKEAIVIPDFDVLGEVFYITLEQCNLFEVSDTAYRVEDFH